MANEIPETSHFLVKGLLGRFEDVPRHAWIGWDLSLIEHLQRLCALWLCLGLVSIQSPFQVILFQSLIQQNFCQKLLLNKIFLIFTKQIA